MSARYKWINGTGGVLKPQGVAPLTNRIAVYGFKASSNGAAGEAHFKQGGASGASRSDLYAPAGGTDRDTIDGNGGFIEMTDGCYVSVTGGVADVAILVMVSDDN